MDQINQNLVWENPDSCIVLTSNLPFYGTPEWLRWQSISLQFRRPWTLISMESFSAHNSGTIFPPEAASSSGPLPFCVNGGPNNGLLRLALTRTRIGNASCPVHCDWVKHQLFMSLLLFSQSLTEFFPVSCGIHYLQNTQ